jgi:hypothetical protein
MIFIPSPPSDTSIDISLRDRSISGVHIQPTFRTEWLVLPHNHTICDFLSLFEIRQTAKPNSKPPQRQVSPRTRSIAHYPRAATTVFLSPSARHVACAPRVPPSITTTSLFANFPRYASSNNCNVATLHSPHRHTRMIRSLREQTRRVHRPWRNIRKRHPRVEIVRADGERHRVFGLYPTPQRNTGL